MIAPAVDDRPVYDTYDAAKMAQDKQLNSYGILSGIVVRADGRYQLLRDITGGAR